MSEEHTIVGQEVYWITQEFEFDEEREKLCPKSIISKDIINSRMDDSSYKCSCGKTFGNFKKAEDHIKRVRE